MQSKNFLKSEKITRFNEVCELFTFRLPLGIMIPSN